MKREDLGNFVSYIVILISFCGEYFFISFLLLFSPKILKTVILYFIGSYLEPIVNKYIQKNSFIAQNL